MKEIDIQLSHEEAIKRYNKGIKPIYSHNIAEEVNCGYGELDEMGIWEFPLYFLEK